MKVLLTGANRQLGLELQAELKRVGADYEIVNTDYNTLDIQT